MKTLVIHPHDTTTDFLCDIYSDKDWSIIRDNVSKKVLKDQIKAHDRIVMLGHGTQDGLIGFAHLMIDSSYVYLLRDKICVCIWCHANIFVDKYKLKGFNTGMFVSDYVEALDWGIFSVNHHMIDMSNFRFATAVEMSIDGDNILKQVQDLYVADNNPVINFNKRNLYYNGN